MSSPLARALCAAERRVAFLMKKNKVDVIWGEAKLTKPARSSSARRPSPPSSRRTRFRRAVKGEGTYTAKHIIVATARARERCPASNRTAS